MYNRREDKAAQFPMPNDDIDHIPAIVPGREGGPQRSPRHGGLERRRSAGTRAQASPAGGSGVFSRLVAGLALIAGGLAFAWAWQLQNQLDDSQRQLQEATGRISDLEARLSDTDEGMNQNAAVQAVKIAELESEVRKLWDNVWKQARERLAKLESASAAQGKSIKGMDSSLASTKSQLDAAAEDLDELKSVGGDLARLMASARTSQAEVERVADSLNRIELSMNKLEKRVAGNEEWIGSVNAFRRQVNASLAELQGTVRTLQATP